MQSSVHRSIEMDPASRELLRLQRPYIVKNIYDTPSILDHLFADDIITVDMKDEIAAKETRSGRIGKLIDLLPARGPEAFGKFMSALENTGYAYLATDLRNQLVELRLKMPFEEQHDREWVHTQLDLHNRCRLITEKELSHISYQLSPSEFFTLGIELGFSRSRLEQYQASNPHSIQIQTFSMLCDWMAREGGHATVVNFVQHTQAAGVDNAVIKDVILGASKKCDDYIGIVV